MSFVEIYLILLLPNSSAGVRSRPVKRRRAATPVKKEARKGQGPSAAKRTKAQVRSGDLGLCSGFHALWSQRAARLT